MNRIRSRGKIPSSEKMGRLHTLGVGPEANLEGGHVEMGRDGYYGGDQGTECGEVGRGEAGWGCGGKGG